MKRQLLLILCNGLGMFARAQTTTGSTTTAATTSSAIVSSSSLDLLSSTPALISTEPSTTTSTAVATPIVTGRIFIGCLEDVVNGVPLLNDQAFLNVPDLTSQTCSLLCSGYRYSGVANGVDCRCGNEFTHALISTPGACGSQKRGLEVRDLQKRQTTGNNIAVFEDTAVVVSSSVSSSSSILTSTLTSTEVSTTASTTTSFTTPVVTGRIFQGCFVDLLDGVPLLTGATFLNVPSLTSQECSILCTGFRYSGVAEFVNCRCGNDYAHVLMPSPEQCTSQRKRDLGARDVHARQAVGNAIAVFLDPNVVVTTTTFTTFTTTSLSPFTTYRPYPPIPWYPDNGFPIRPPYPAGDGVDKDKGKHGGGPPEKGHEGGPPGGGHGGGPPGGGHGGGPPGGAHGGGAPGGGHGGGGGSPGGGHGGGGGGGGGKGGGGGGGHGGGGHG